MSRCGHVPYVEALDALSACSAGSSGLSRISHYLLAMPAPTPFDLVFATRGADDLPAIRAALAATGHDPADRDAFLMIGRW